MVIDVKWAPKRPCFFVNMSTWIKKSESNRSSNPHAVGRFSNQTLERIVLYKGPKASTDPAQKIQVYSVADGKIFGRYEISQLAKDIELIPLPISKDIGIEIPFERHGANVPITFKALD